MDIKRISIRNFKGIKSLTIDFSTLSPLRFYTLIGLNESGKTTILEAINNFTYGPELLIKSKDERIAKLSPDEIVPISGRANFNDRIDVTLEIKLSLSDIQYILSRLKENHPEVKYIDINSDLTVTTASEFKDSAFVQTMNYFGLRFKIKDSVPRSRWKDITNSKEDIWQCVADSISDLFPDIIYFPDFAFAFPGRIYLDSKNSQVDDFYKKILQDILNTIGSNYSVGTHILERLKSNTESDQKNLDALLTLIKRNLEKIIINDWKNIFGNDLDTKKIIVKTGHESNNTDGHYYIEFKIEDGNGITTIEERSLGFKWFFIFRLLTYYRGFRNITGISKKVVFLLDEPASNLHQTAQMRLLKCFEEFPENCYVIYTTHSHHLINPKWLENAYIIKNDAISYLEDLGDYKETNITATKYRTFVAKYPDDVNYFKPVMDVLDYRPSSLESIKDALLVEGKNDYYTISYLLEVFKIGDLGFNIVPGLGSGKLDTLISLYMGWGKNFYILLDNDKRIQQVIDHYQSEWGVFILSKIFKINDATGIETIKAMESLFSDEDKKAILGELPYTKTNFNRRIQELLASQNDTLVFSKELEANFRSLIKYIKKRFSHA